VVEHDGPLVGVRVLDIGNLIAGPMVATLLGDLGAEVIKVEHPVHGDPLRVFGRLVDGQSLYWKTVGRNKRCITLDLSKPGGQRVLKKLVAVSDILTENFRAGTLERWGMDWGTLKGCNPDLVIVRTSGFGQSGPYSDRPGFGTLAEAMSGFSYMTGEPDAPRSSRSSRSPTGWPRSSAASARWLRCTTAGTAEAGSGSTTTCTNR